MFYLREFTQLFKTHFLMTTLFIFSLVGMISVMGHRDVIERQVAQFQKSNMTSYFNALISGESNISGVKRKMKNLPGVLDVVVSTSKDLKNEISHLKTNFGEDTIDKLSSLSYQKIKIELEEHVSLKNQSLIREYLGRLLGTENITLGAIKEPKGLKLNENDPVFKVLNQVEFYLLGIFFVIFTLSTSVLMKSVHKKSFVIKKFQRRNMVSFKILISGVLLGLIPALVLNIVAMNSINPLIAIPLFMVVMIIFINTYQELLPSRSNP